MVRDPARLHQQPTGAIRRRVVLGRLGLHSLLVLLAMLLAVASPLTALAQGQPPRSLRIVPTVLPDREPEDVGDEGEVGVAGTVEMIIDTDPGVDDAAALIWLFSQTRVALHVRGIVTVAGNTNVYSATTNALLLLDWLGDPDVKVVRGAATPSVQIASKTNQLIHGPDGLWGTSAVYPPPVGSSSDLTATQFYCGDEGSGATSALEPGVTVLALGPLTNIAAAIATCKEKWNGVRIVTLGGAKDGGNQTPVSEYNYWQDPEAASFVFANAVDAAELTGEYGPYYVYTQNYIIEQVPEEAFDQFVLTAQTAKELYKSPNAAMANLLLPLSLYFCALTQQCITDDYGVPQTNQFGVPTLYKVDEQGNFIIDRRGNPIPVPDGQVVFPPLPDPVAAVYALNGSLGTQQQALVKIVAGDVPQYVRGQSVVGLSFAEQLSMNASDQEFNGLIDLLFSDQLTFLEFFGTLYLIVAREPQNATFVYDVAAHQMINRFLRYVANNDGESDRASIDVVGDPAPTGSEQLLLPMVSDN